MDALTLHRRVLSGYDEYVHSLLDSPIAPRHEKTYNQIK